MAIKYVHAHFLYLSLLLCSCGNDQRAESTSQKQEEFIPGNYRVILRPLNNLNLKHASQGVGTITLVNGHIEIKFKMIKTPGLMIHQQQLHPGPHCPDSSSDSNQNGEIEIDEVISASGEPLLNLSANPGPPQSDEHKFPRSDRSGSYSYFSKLKVEQMNYFLHKKVVVIYGDPSSNEQLPTACGVIQVVPAE